MFGTATSAFGSIGKTVATPVGNLWIYNYIEPGHAMKYPVGTVNVRTVAAKYEAVDEGSRRLVAGAEYLAINGEKVTVDALVTPDGRFEHLYTDLADRVLSDIRDVTAVTRHSVYRYVRDAASTLFEDEEFMAAAQKRAIFAENFYAYKNFIDAESRLKIAKEELLNAHLKAIRLGTFDEVRAEEMAIDKANGIFR